MKSVSSIIPLSRLSLPFHSITMSSRLSLLLLLLLFCSLSSAFQQTAITLTLHRLPPPPHPDPLRHLASIAAASLRRAARLKNPKPSAPPATAAPLSPHSYGGYSIPLSLGTPPQPLLFLFDTGSSLTWTPCTHSYRCTNCSSPANPSATIPAFLPKSSSSARLVGCKNPKCEWIHSPDFLSRCRLDCPSANCTQICPPYGIIYGSGSTAGLLLSETLYLPDRAVPGFAVGCSLYSDGQPGGGIAGFGRGPPSLPAQLGLRRFSYCLISRRFDDDARESGSLVLDASPDSASDGVSFTPFIRTPNTSSESVYSVYYYIALRRVTVGGKKVRIPHSALVPGPSGDGGSIIDSGTTFTYMAPAVFDPLVEAFEEAVAGRYNRSAEAEELTGLRPCFELPEGAKGVTLPEMVLHFKGGAEMRLPPENYFAFVDRSRESVCLTVMSDGGAGSGGAAGPAVILGSFQQQNYYMVYDLERERLGFRRQSCIGS